MSISTSYALKATLLKSKTTNHIYQYEGRTDTESSLVNLTTGKSGKIQNEKMKDLFVIPLLLNHMIQENSNLLEVIKILNLRHELQ